MRGCGYTVEIFFRTMDHSTVKILHSFVPKVISSYIALDSTGDKKLNAALAPIVRVKLGAILLVDISGFTRLSGFGLLKVLKELIIYRT